MISLIFPLLCWFSFFSTSLLAVDPNLFLSNKIVGGNVARIWQVPYLVRLQHVDGEHWCGATLVSDQHVVTAAHCLEDVDPLQELLVVAGVSNLRERGQVFSITGWRVPTAYNPQTFDMDFGLLKLNDSVSFGLKTQAIPLCSRHLEAGDTVRVSGFGRTTGSSGVSHQLRTVLLETITHDSCSRYWNITNSMLCTQSPPKGPCQYDSGGPLEHDGELCGIVSWGRSDCEHSSGYPTMFTDVAAIRDLIETGLDGL